MIEPWQVWMTDLDPIEGHEQSGMRPAVVVSSDFHIRLSLGRTVTVMPLTSTASRRSYRVPVENPHNGRISFGITEQIRTISTSRFERDRPWWVLKDQEVDQIRRAMRAMVDL